MVDVLVFVLEISRCILLRCQQSNSELYIHCLHANALPVMYERMAC